MDLPKDNYQKSLQTLEDLYLLGEPNLYPVIDRLYFHLEQMSLASNVSLPDLTHKNLRSLFVEKVNLLIDGFFHGLSQKAKVTFDHNLNRLELSDLDVIVQILPKIFELSSQFSFERNFNISVRKEKVTFMGDVSTSLDLESMRLESYKMLRYFFDQEVWFTFDVFESNDSDFFTLGFTFTFKDTKRKLLINREAGSYLTLNKEIEQFQQDINQLKRLGNHHVIVIDSNANVETYDSFNSAVLPEENSQVGFHFPFLFRPISLIIKGNIDEALDTFSPNLSATGCREEEKSLSGGYEFNTLEIDLFKIFQN